MIISFRLIQYVGEMSPILKRFFVYCTTQLINNFCVQLSKPLLFITYSTWPDKMFVSCSHVHIDLFFDLNWFFVFFLPLSVIKCLALFYTVFSYTVLTYGEQDLGIHVIAQFTVVFVYP